MTLKKRALLHECLKKGRSPFSTGNRHRVRCPNALRVSMVADLAMCPPGSPGRALRATKSGKTPLLPDKAKRRKRREPGKPFSGRVSSCGKATLVEDRHGSGVGAKRFTHGAPQIIAHPSGLPHRS